MRIVGLIIVLVVAVAIALSIVKKKKGDDVADECAKGDVKAISEEKDTKQSQANPSQQTSETKAVEPEKTQVEINKNVQPLMSEDEIKEILANREHPEAGSLPYILVAEDNMSNYKLIEVMLRNIAVTENAVNGKKAVERAKKVAYDMILMDIKMPVMNGLEATNAIRQFDREVPIIAVTANVLDFDKNLALANGCNEFVTKPVIRKRLCEVVETYNKRK